MSLLLLTRRICTVDGWEQTYYRVQMYTIFFFLENSHIDRFLNFRIFFFCLLSLSVSPLDSNEWT